MPAAGASEKLSAACWSALSVSVSVAALLVTLPEVLEINTVYIELWSDDPTAGVVYEAEVAPAMLVPFLRHW